MTSEIESQPTLLFSDAISEPREGTRKLTVTTFSSVQPAVLMKMGVFVPERKKGAIAQPIDATDDLSLLSFASKEGYSDIVMSGPRLNLTTDFKVWLGIIHAFSKSPEALKGNKITIGFREFARFCEYDNKRYDSRLRKEIRDSLTRIRSKTITFSKPNQTKVYITGLLKTSFFDIENDQITLEADEKLWELYSEDNVTLLRKKPLRALPRKESAQALYTFIASLPANPIPLSFDRIKERLLLTSPVKEQNRIIKRALADLEKIGYLKYELITGRDKQTKVKILSRNPTLKAEDI